MKDIPKNITAKQWTLLFSNFVEVQSYHTLKLMHDEFSANTEKTIRHMITNRGLVIDLPEKEKIALAVFDACSPFVELKNFKTMIIGKRVFDLSDSVVKEIEKKIKLIDMMSSDVFPSHSEVLMRENPLPNILGLFSGHVVQLNHADLTLKFKGGELILLEKDKAPENNLFGNAILSMVEDVKEKIIADFDAYLEFSESHNKVKMPERTM